MTTTFRTRIALRVRAAPLLPEGDEGWLPYPEVWVSMASLGHGSQHGEATLIAEWGVRTLPGESAAAALDPELAEIPAGWWVRLQPAEVGDPGTDVDWVGRVIDHLPDPDRRETRIRCLEARADLAGMPVLRCWELQPDESAGQGADCPAFNQNPAGDASAIDVTVDEIDCPVFDRRPGEGVRWTARSATRYLLSTSARSPLPGVAAAPTRWLLDPTGPDAACERLPLLGETIGLALNRLWNPARGRSWRTLGIAGPEITLAALDLAATPAHTLDVSESPWIALESLTLRQPRHAAHVLGGPSRLGLTLWYDPANPETSALLPEFDPEADPARIDDWDDDRPFDLPDWRRWRLNPAWDGRTYDSADDGLTSLSNTDGDRAWADGAANPTGVRLDRHLPCGLDFSDETGGARQPPLALVGSGSAWTDLSQNGITCLADPATLLLGSTAAHAAALRDALAESGAVLLVTVGVIEPAPLLAYAEPPAGEWPFGLPDGVHLSRPQLERHRIAVGTVSGIDPDTGALQLSEGGLLRDDQPIVLSLLDDLVARHLTTSPQVTHLTWTETGALRTDIHPGDRVTSLILPNGDGTTRTLPCSAVIRTVTWFTESDRYGTRIDAAPITTDTPHR